ncbi:flagellar hook-basal body complex protein FliE [Pelagibacterium lentulum]|uniref:Flagellar hook-basal body complex protein FliE n=1 Tax=Pelagibacterium lentulum TaxID=2029865 RepID=A0A916R9L9_9HYPH|nr:flagellar hook-basal body complex protein FliE [Pelagibacterium lentulum]GGA47811.1 flagellar hook-basal body complex protein FliE 1 [Pelagibacterium lentulum]
MSTPFNIAVAAYGNVSKLASEQPAAHVLPVAGEVPGAGGDFGQLLSQQLEGISAVGKVSDQVSLDMVNGNANVVDVVTALAETEVAMETMVTVRDRVISAYEEIMRMPI